MSAFSEAALEKKLSELSNSQQSVQTLSLWLIHHRKHSRPIVTVWERELRKGESPAPRHPACSLAPPGPPAPLLGSRIPLATPAHRCPAPAYPAPPAPCLRWSGGWEKQRAPRFLQSRRL